MPVISSRTVYRMARGAILPILLAVKVCQGAVVYQIATFDVAGYEGSTVLVGVNNLGDMVGGVGPRGNETGFIQLHTGQVTLVTVPGAYQTVAEGINDDGVVVGFYSLPSGPAPGPFGFVRATDGAITTYKSPGGGATQLTGLNNQGQAVGWFAGPDANTAIAFILNIATNATTTFSVKGSHSTEGYGINSSGTVTGFFEPQEFFVQPYIRASDGTIQLFQLVDQQQGETYAYCINDSGAVAGSYYLNSTAQYTYVRAKSGAIIATFNAGKGGSISGMNNSFVVVGTFDGQGNTEHGFIGTPESSQAIDK